MMIGVMMVGIMVIVIAMVVVVGEYAAAQQDDRRYGKDKE